MASSNIAYCNDNDLLDVYPNISGYDLKRRIYGWQASVINEIDGSIDCYYANNTGFVNQLFADGHKIIMTTYNTTATTTLVADLADTLDNISVADESAFGTDDILKIGNEYMLAQTTAVVDGVGVVSCSDRPAFGTDNIAHSSGDNVYKIMDAGDYGNDDGAEVTTFHAVYDSDLDKVLLLANTNPNDILMEAGEDWATIKTRFRKRACRLFESEIDSRFVREISKDREGNYPDVIIRATALKTVMLLMKAHDPNNEIIGSFDMEYNEIVRGIRSGAITLPNSITQDSGKGVIREVSVNASTTLRPVSIIGDYQGSGYDLLKVVVSTAGAVGVAKMTVYQKDGDKLKTDTSVDAEIIDGDYQFFAPGLRIRWSAAVIDGSTDVATLNDEYEIEVYGQSIDSTQQQVGTVSLTRR